MMALGVVALTEPASIADQIRTTRPQIQGQSPLSVDWSQVRGAVAISTTRATNGLTSIGASANATNAPFLSTAVMISPTIGVTAAHCLDGIIDAAIIDDMLVKPHSKRIKIANKAVHPDYKGNNFSGIDFAVFELQNPLKIEHYFKPVAIGIEPLKNEVLQRIGFGERDKENRRTWILENYKRRNTGTHYLTSEDKYGYPGDSGGPVYRTRQNQNGPELVGIHVGRMLDNNGKALDESNTLVLTPDLLDWIQKTVNGWKNEKPASSQTDGPRYLYPGNEAQS